jgi:TraY domain-containing protein
MAKASKGGRMGRPTKAPTPGERNHLGLRVTAELKQRLEQAAERAGRSLSQDVEMRLERSFDFDAALGGNRLSKIIKAIAQAMKMAGEEAAEDAKIPVATWLSHPYPFDQAVKAALTLLECIRPPGDAAPPVRVVSEFDLRYLEGTGQRAAWRALRDSLRDEVSAEKRRQIADGWLSAAKDLERGAEEIYRKQDEIEAERTKPKKAPNK